MAVGHLKMSRTLRAVLHLHDSDSTAKYDTLPTTKDIDMAFEHTLRSVQAARAASTIGGCISIIFFAFVIQLRAEARSKFLKELQDNHPGLFEVEEPAHSTWGGLALVGVSWHQSMSTKRHTSMLSLIHI